MHDANKSVWKLPLFYHCVTRCVRRSFWCGDDKYSGRNYDHRRGWIEERSAAVTVLLLAEVFYIELAGYSMRNHYHVILNVYADDALTLTHDQVIQRWLILYRGSELVQRYNSGEQLTNAEFKQLKSTIEQYCDNCGLCSRATLLLSGWIFFGFEPISENYGCPDHCRCPDLCTPDLSRGSRCPDLLEQPDGDSFANF